MGPEKQYFRSNLGQDPLFDRWPPPESAPFDAEFNSAPNPSPISANPSGIANPDEEYHPDGSWKAVFPGQDPLFDRWTPPESAPFDAEFNSAPNPSPISANPSGIANPEKKSRIWCQLYQRVRSIYKGARAQTRSLPSHPPDLLADEMGTMLSWGQSSRTSCLSVNDDDDDDDDHDQDEKKEWGKKQKSNDTNTHTHTDRQNKQIYACMHVRETEGEREKWKRLWWSEEDLRSIEVNNQQDEQDEVDCSRHEYEREYPFAFTFFDWTIEKKTFRLDRSEIGDVSIELMSLFFRESSFIVIDQCHQQETIEMHLFGSSTCFDVSITMLFTFDQIHLTFFQLRTRWWTSLTKRQPRWLVLLPHLKRWKSTCLCDH